MTEVAGFADSGIGASRWEVAFSCSGVLEFWSIAEGARMVRQWADVRLKLMG